jgi:hypothetical protein
MRRQLIFILLNALLWTSVSGQESDDQGSKLLFQGIVMEKQNENPLPNAQIFINRTFSSVSNDHGRFAFYAAKNDTVTFSLLGYKPLTFYISDTLAGKEFVAGIYMRADTVSIDEVVILPRLANLKADIFSPRSETSRQHQNASNNLALSAYQARMTQNKLGDPSLNYEVLRQRQKDSRLKSSDAYSGRLYAASRPSWEACAAPAQSD